ncbi:hypothetical protein, partial [Cylindrospermopsis raciborskii]
MKHQLAKLLFDAENACKLILEFTEGKSYSEYSSFNCSLMPRASDRTCHKKQCVISHNFHSGRSHLFPGRRRSPLTPTFPTSSSICNVLVIGGGIDELISLTF